MNDSDAITTRGELLDRLDRANTTMRCYHIRPNGLRCGSPAMRGNAFCYFHDRWYNGSSEDSFPPLEDGNGVQVALMHVLERLRRAAFRGGEVDPSLAKTLILGLKAASSNLRHANFAPLDFDHNGAAAVVTSTSADALDAAEASQAAAIAARTPSFAQRGNANPGPAQAKKRPRSDAAAAGVEKQSLGD